MELPVAITTAAITEGVVITMAAATTGAVITALL